MWNVTSDKRKYHSIYNSPREKRSFRENFYNDTLLWICGKKKNEMHKAELDVISVQAFEYIAAIFGMKRIFENIQFLRSMYVGLEFPARHESSDQLEFA